MRFIGLAVRVEKVPKAEIKREGKLDVIAADVTASGGHG